jgi:hypothetical protein
VYWTAVHRIVTKPLLYCLAKAISKGIVEVDKQNNGFNPSFNFPSAFMVPTCRSAIFLQRGQTEPGSLVFVSWHLALQMGISIFRLLRVEVQMMSLQVI